MEVVDVPTFKPVITEIKSHYRISELVRGNCTSQFSRPACNLTWLINDKPVSLLCVETGKQFPTLTSFLSCFQQSEHRNSRQQQHQIPSTIGQYKSVKDETRNLFSNTIGLFLRLNQQHFINGRLKVTLSNFKINRNELQTRSFQLQSKVLLLKLKSQSLTCLTSFHLQISCIASLYTLYNERAERFIDEDRPTVFSASASQSFIDTPSSHYSSYQDMHDTANNHNDAQIQGKLLPSSNNAKP